MIMIVTFENKDSKSYSSTKVKFEIKILEPRIINVEAYVKKLIRDKQKPNSGVKKNYDRNESGNN
ncbi:hypothetical protein X798_00001 [Onchocerca flexuosa]|uniref:Uncharacterized protein n=1 Tax=Onchocerca flexuosa TaxID=387005 RepID=A0A238C5R9_9BILA|nr:hypothetical protein X798_00001 [Onchocerca flexuosa]